MPSKLTYTDIDYPAIFKDNGVDLHCWIETNEGKIIDEYFSDYDLVKLFHNLKGDNVYCELVGKERKKVWGLVWKKFLKNKIQSIEDLGCFGCENWYSFWEHCECRQHNCFMNAYQYHLQNPKTTRLCFGKLGWKKKKGKSIWWEFG